MKTDVLFSSATDEWETPQDLFDALNEEFHFTLDSCANDQNAKCKRYYTKSEDGLEMPWDGVVWCNPPYGRTVGNWVKKAYDAAKDGAVVVMLLPARTDTRWFHDYIYEKADVRFLRGRLRFGGSATNAPFPNMIVVFKEVRDGE